LNSVFLSLVFFLVTSHHPHSPSFSSSTPIYHPFRKSIIALKNLSFLVKIYQLSFKQQSPNYWQKYAKPLVFDNSEQIKLIKDYYTAKFDEMPYSPKMNFLQVWGIESRIF